MEKQGHPRLRRSRTESMKYTHGLSQSEMESLSSICDAFLPSLPSQTHSPDSVKTFFATSASQNSIPDEVAELAKKRGLPEVMLLVRVVLWILSTRIGTLLLCGSLCFGKQSPFITKFSHLPTERREEILQRWSRSKYMFFLRAFFYFAKSLCLFVFVAKFDEESNTNPAWEAMDYKPDDPKNLPKMRPRPLDQGIIETFNESPTTFIQSLTQKGLKVIEEPQNNLYKVQCDVVIIGSGCGGAVAASILASSGQKVIVLEKGNYYTSSDYSLLEKPSMDELLEQGGMLPTTDGGVILMAAKVVGGGSAVNWSASLKTPKKVLREWEEDDGLPVFGSEEYAVAMDAVCKRIGVTEECVKEGFQNQVLRKGCENLGVKVDKVPRNSPPDHYCGSCHYGCRTGEKQGTDVTWLVDAVKQGCVIVTACKAEKLILVDNNKKPSTRKKKKRCIGVVAKSLNKNITRMIQIEAKVTISACGALFTPPLLISSGLRNKHIGKNLHLHPTMMLWGYFPDEPGSEFEGKIHQGGLITSAHELKRSEEDDSTIALVETPALGPSSFAAIVTWESGLDAKQMLIKYSRTSHLFCMVRDQGSGQVTKEGRVSYRMSSQDKENMTAGMRRALRILVAAGAEEVGTYRSDGQRLKCKGVKEGELEEFLGTVEAVNGPYYDPVWGVYCTAHQIGSCKMGRTERDGAVDERGESWEAEGLFVCDGSVMPSAVGVNPMVTIQATAYCIANNLAESINKKGV
ncbi:hypothetical protein V2J09_023217 [Rumex salicifolius]